MILRIYTDHDGQTHFEDLPLPAEESHNIALQAGANLTFRCFPADYWSDWHTAPRRQYIDTVAGSGAIPSDCGAAEIGTAALPLVDFLQCSSKGCATGVVISDMPAFRHR